MQTAILNINGMTCMGCVTSIEKVLEKIAGVSDSDISLKKKQAKIQYDPERTNINKLKEAIVGAGFEINI
jgi:copper chaperone|uniref:Heavy-metal-associated domain protein n=1 Tax=uncultured marine bacterium 577 TaxID=257398 RepID=Q6SG08_9BACT|nr:heavy-metal-associated domain protein [uncultured marine bacterium 577]